MLPRREARRAIHAGSTAGPGSTSIGSATAGEAAASRPGTDSSQAASSPSRGSSPRRSASAAVNVAAGSGHRTSTEAVSVPRPPRTARVARSTRSGHPVPSTPARNRDRESGSPSAVIPASAPAVPSGGRTSGWSRSWESSTPPSPAVRTRNSRSPRRSWGAGRGRRAAPRPAAGARAAPAPAAVRVLSRADRVCTVERRGKLGRGTPRLTPDEPGERNGQQDEQNPKPEALVHGSTAPGQAGR